MLWAMKIYTVRGERVRQLREEMGWTQGDLARIVARSITGVNQSQISQVERGEAGFRPESLAAVAIALETSTDYLLGLTDDPTRREDMGEQVILTIRDPARRDALQQLFNGIEKLPDAQRDDYLRAVMLMLDGVIASGRRQHEEQLRRGLPAGGGGHSA